MIKPKRVWKWVDDADKAWAKAFREAKTDIDYYNGDQWTEEEKQELQERGQPVLTLNFIKPTLDVVIGTETRVRTDIRVLPRGVNDQALADILSAAIRFELDLNDGEYALRSAFESMLKVGVGWVVVEPHPYPERATLLIETVPFIEMLLDPASVRYDLTDAKFIIRRKWMDIDDVINRFPSARKLFRENEFGEWDYIGAQEDAGAPKDETDIIRHTAPPPDIMGGVKQWKDGDWYDKEAGRVLVLEVNYRTIEERSVMVNALTGERERFDPNAINKFIDINWNMEYGPVEVLREAIVIGSHVLIDKEYDVQCGLYKYFPIWAFRDSKNAFFGFVRQMRDAQSDLNKRAIKALHIMNTNQVLIEEGAFEEGDEDLLRSEISRPDGFIVLKRNALTDKRVQVLRDTSLAQQQMAIANQRRIEIQETTGVNMEMVGGESNAVSGRAILARQAQGNTIMAPIFDNYRRSKRLLGYYMAKLIQLYYQPGKYIRIVDDYGAAGNTIFPADVKDIRYDVVVGESPYTETQKQQFAAELSALLRQSPPEIAPAIFKVWLKLVDVPYKDEIARELEIMQQMSVANAQMAQDRMAIEMDESVKDRTVDRLAKLSKILSPGSAIKAQSDAALGGQNMSETEGPRP